MTGDDGRAEAARHGRAAIQVPGPIHGHGHCRRAMTVTVTAQAGGRRLARRRALQHWQCSRV